MDEAVKIADKVCIMKEGHIVQYDTPENILKNPANDFVSDFVGKNRIWDSPEFIKISDIMIEKPVTCSKELSILKCMEKMRSRKIDSLLIVEPKTKKFEGIIKARNIRVIKDKSTPVGNVMMNPSLTLKPDDTILDALKIVNEHHTSTVPVIDNNILVGLVTRSTLVTMLSQQYMDVEVE